MRATSGTVTFLGSIRRRPPRTGGPGGRQGRRAKVRPGEPLVEQLEDALVELEFVGVERERREDRVLGEEIVGDRPAAEEIPLTELALLAVALEQEEELGLEGISLGFLVESPQEG